MAATVRLLSKLTPYSITGSKRVKSPWGPGGGGVKVENVSSVSPACRKRRLIGAVCRNIKRLVPCRCLDDGILRKFYGRYGNLTKQYEVPLSRMLHDIMEDMHIQWHPPLMRHYTDFWPFTDLIWELRNWGFHRTFAAGAACQQRTLTPGPVPLLDLHVF